jgi:alkanesulfonate monooxygenase SsuD/methylene tetrahydromethanopterin reductase-like flavin-dependent oxidoreductase (luciferase family)
MRVGIMLPIAERDSRMPSWDELRALAEAAERSGLDSIWVPDHFFAGIDAASIRGIHEAWTLISALSAVTSRIEIGPLVLCASFRHPGLVAKMAATADEVSGGRLVLGLGAGWYDAEYEAFGFPTDHRVSRFAEWLEIVARLLRGERVAFEGRYHTLPDAYLAPAPARHIPILVAAERPRMLGLAAQWADEWITVWYRSAGEDTLRKKVTAFEEGLTAAGRDPATIRRIVGFEVDDAGLPPGTLDACEALGFDHVVVRFDSPSVDAVQRLAASRG